MEKIKKKYALNNSYFKNRHPDWPADPFEVYEYFQEHKELPYKGEVTKNWLYECFVEYQKRAGVRLSQFFTPPATARRMAEIAYEYSESPTKIMLDACSGFGMLTMALEELGVIVKSFDVDDNFRRVNSSFFEVFDFRYVTETGWEVIVSNPPYEPPILIDFLECVIRWLKKRGTAVLLLPKDFIDLTRTTRRMSAIMSHLDVIRREPMLERFAHTNVRAEIVVLKKWGYDGK
jgi:hypothetical protein